MTEEIQALAQALNSGEAECNGVKFIVMDQDTVYRFENNRMKKVAKTLLNKAKKFVNQAVPPHPGNDFDEEGNVLEEKPAPKPRGRKKAQPVQPIPDEPEDDFDEEPVPPPKPKRSRAKAQPVVPEIDINDYYNTKNRLEFVQQENERLNGKVKKLKQYKQILNKLSGIEYDDQTLNLYNSVLLQLKTNAFVKNINKSHKNMLKVMEVVMIPCFCFKFQF